MDNVNDQFIWEHKQHLSIFFPFPWEKMYLYFQKES